MVNASNEKRGVGRGPLRGGCPMETGMAQIPFWQVSGKSAFVKSLTRTRRGQIVGSLRGLSSRARCPFPVPIPIVEDNWKLRVMPLYNQYCLVQLARLLPLSLCGAR